MQLPPSPTLGADDDHLSSVVLAQRLSANRVLREYRVLAEVGSTNTYLLEEAREADEGLVILAEYQTAGRGRLGRTWVAPARSAISCSILLRPRLPIRDHFLLTAACALAVRATLAPLVTAPVRVKWPNDVLLGGRKVCGILAETTHSSNGAVFVLGFGVNVHVAPNADVATNATCIAHHASLPTTRTDVVVPILITLDALLVELYAGGSERLWREWRDGLDTIGREVEVDGPTGKLRGRAVDVGRDGGLVVELPDGTHYTVYAGDAIEPP